MIFLQLGTLGFILGIGSLLLLMIRNLHAQRDEIRFMSDLGFSRNTLFWAYCVENLWLYLASAVFSLAVLCLLALVAQLHHATLFIGWTLLTTLGVTLIFITMRVFFYHVTNPIIKQIRAQSQSSEHEASASAKDIEVT
jgi:hypothetical protein